MDRYGEIYTTYRLIMEGAAAAPEATILCNGDSPILIQRNCNLANTMDLIIYHRKSNWLITIQMGFYVQNVIIFFIIK